MRKSLVTTVLSAGLLLGAPALAQAQPSETSPPTTQVLPGGPDVQPMGTTCVQPLCAGQLTTTIPSRTSNQSFTFKAHFQSYVVGVNNARLQVRMLGFQGQLVAEENRYWSGNQKVGEFVKGQSYWAPVASVCATLWEGGIQLGTACEPV